MQIYDVRHGTRAGDKNSYCGPSALSAVTGMSTGEAARLLRFVSKKRSIRGTSTLSMSRAMALCGIRLVGQRVRVEHRVDKAGNMKARGLDTLAGWLSNTVSLRQAGRVFLLAAGNHWQIISGRRYVCGQTGEIVAITDKKVKRRAKVTEVWELTGTKITIPEQAKECKTKNWITKANAKSYAAFRKFVRDNGITYKIYDECGCKYIQTGPTLLWPEGIDTMHYGFAETLERLLHCMEHPGDVHDGSYSE